MKNRKQRQLNSGFRFMSCLLTAVLLTAFLREQAFAAETGAAHAQINVITAFYGLMTVLSLLLFCGYCRRIRQREVWFLLLYAAVFVVNLGYFTLSVSGTLGMAMMANRFAYLGSVFLPLCMLMTIMRICQLPCGKRTLSLLIGISVAVFLLAASGGYLDLYYKEVSLIFVDGAAKLQKIYGPCHNIYYVYLFAYFGAMVGVIIYSVLKKHTVSHKHAILLAGLTMGNILVWLVEQMISWNFEFLSVSYVLTELFLLMLYDLLQDYEEKLNLAGEEQHAAQEDEIHFTAEQIQMIMKVWPGAAQLTAREQDVFCALLENKRRKEIADELFVSENTIKKHTAHIFAKLCISNRKELFALVNGDLTTELHGE